MTDLLARLQPLCYTAIVIVIIISFIKSILKGDFKNLIWQMILCALVAYMVYNPNSLFLLGQFIVETTLSLGGDLLGSTQIQPTPAQ